MLQVFLVYPEHAEIWDVYEVLWGCELGFCVTSGVSEEEVEFVVDDLVVDDGVGVGSTDA